MTGEGASPRLPHRLGMYELLRPLAQGGMADIYLARRLGPGQFERQVALKVLSERRADDPEACAMFLDEARLVAMLHHRNIASVLEVDVVDGKHYLAMEYVHGADLREVLLATQRTGARMPFATAIAIVCAAAAGLDHAHRRCSSDGKPLKLVHRDVSLSNIMLGHDGSVKVIDFGIATTTIASVHTSPGVVRGKASYMSPEQCMGDPIDHRSDVFALGVVLYELTTGVRCFHGKTDFDRMLAVVRTEYLAPSELVAGYPAALEAVIRTALAAKPRQRFASAAAMIEALEHIAAHEGWTGGPSVIERLMTQLFGDVSAPLPSLTDVEIAPPLPLAPPVAEPTRP
ncbi:MAG: serine/threonine protein kinase, partial [Myxococcales bacterium]|nr:serine/threonine protein kinase [Myxococcales bacterium]